MIENGKELSDQQLLKYGLELLSDACCHLYEINSDEGKAVAFMANAALEYGQRIFNEQDPLIDPDMIANDRMYQENQELRNQLQETLKSLKILHSAAE